MRVAGKSLGTVQLRALTVDWFDTPQHSAKAGAFCLSLFSEPARRKLTSHCSQTKAANHKDPNL